MGRWEVGVLGSEGEIKYVCVYLSI
jgi:hypothetical protein